MISIALEATWRASTLSPGTAVDFCFLVLSEACSDNAAGTKEDSALAGKGERLKVLVVDDEEPIRRLAQEILTEQNYEVILAESTEQALSILDEQAIDLVVSDVGLPGLSGLELLADVQHRWPELPLFLTTGSPSKALREQASAAGAAGLILKPWNVDEFLAAVSGAAGRG